MIPILIFLLFTVSYASAANGACNEAGFKCRSKCTELVRCVNSGGGTTEQVVRKCPGTINQFCDASALDCRGDSCKDDGLEEGALNCYEDGTYPHPTKCDKYFVCKMTISPSLVIKTCANNITYNGSFRNCSSTMDTRACREGPLPICQKVGDIGAYPEDTSIYYVCAYDDNGYLRPQLHSCAQFTYYYPEEKLCRANAATSLQISFAAGIAFLLARSVS